MSALMTLVAIAILMGIAALLAIVVDRWVGRSPAPVADAPGPVVPTSVVPVVPDAPAQRPRDLVTIHLRSERGQSLGSIKMHRHERRPTLQCRPKGSQTDCTFVADRTEGGQFVYRRVGQERIGA